MQFVGGETMPAAITQQDREQFVGGETMPAAITQQDDSRRRRRSGAATSQIDDGSQGSDGGDFSLSGQL